jgi:hypothetical protein
MDLQPFGPDAIAIEPLLQVVRVLVLHLVFVRAAIFQRGRLIHVHASDVVTVHGWVIHVQLKKTTQN